RSGKCKSLDARIAFLGKVLGIGKNDRNISVKRIQDRPAQCLRIIEFDGNSIGLRGNVRLEQLGLQIDITAFRSAVNCLDTQVLAGILDPPFHDCKELNLWAADEIDVELRFVLGGTSCNQCAAAGQCQNSHYEKTLQSHLHSPWFVRWMRACFVCALRPAASHIVHSAGIGAHEVFPSLVSKSKRDCKRLQSRRKLPAIASSSALSEIHRRRRRLAMNSIAMDPVTNSVPSAFTVGRMPISTCAQM